MLSCFTKWKGTSSHGKTLIVLTEYIEPIHRNVSVGQNKIGLLKGKIIEHPSFAKNFQQGLEKTHEKMHKHICAFCFSTGKQLDHAQKDCMNIQKRVNGFSSVGYSSPDLSVVSSKSCMTKQKVKGGNCNLVEKHGEPGSCDDQT